MKKVTSLILLIVSWSVASAQLLIDENKYNIDESRHLIVCNQLPDVGQNPTLPIQLKMGTRTFTFPQLVQSLNFSTKFTVTENGNTFALYFSKFPLVNFNIADPGKINPDDEIPGSLTIADPATAVLNSNMAIRIRGNSSTFFPKKNYRVQFKDANGKNRDESILGLRSDKRWLFFGMWNEEIRMNNVISHKLWIDMHKVYYADQEPKALSSIRMKYVEVFMNKSYIGLYAVGEDMDRKQLQLKKEDSSGSRGELFKADDWSLSSSFGGMGGPKPASGTTDWQNWQLEYPDVSDWTNHYNFLKSMIETSDDEFKNTVWNNLKQENAIDYFIFLNLLRVEDNTEKNFFVARYDQGQPWFFVPWDLDGTWGYKPDGTRAGGADGERTNNLFKRLIKLDPDGFKNKLATRYFALRQTLLSEAALKERFNTNFDQLNANLVYERDNIVSQDKYGQSDRSGGLNYTLSYITQRLAWLDKYFCPLLTSGNCSDAPTTSEPVDVCLEAENSNGNGSISGDPNASGTLTRGDQDNYDRYVDYVVNGVPSAGTYKLKITYFASGTPTVRILVNGNPVISSVQLPSTHSWNIVNREQEMDIALVQGNNTIRIQGLPGAALRQDKICVTGAGTTTPQQPVTCNFSITAGASTTTPSCSTAFSLTAGCSGGDCDAVSYQWTGNGINQTGKSVNITSPATNGTFIYQLTTSKTGCENKNASISVAVSSCQPPTEDPGSEDPGTGEPPTGQPINVCVEAENSNGNGSISSDPNASGTLTRGDQNNYDRYVDYVVNGVPSAGTYKLIITYFASGTPAVRISVNGNTVTQSMQLPSTHSWNIVNREQEMNIALVQGNNTIRIQGLSGAALRQDKICVIGEGTMTPQNPVTCNFNVTAGASTTTPSCSTALTLTAGCSGGDCDAVSYQWSGNGINQSGKSINITSPAINGTFNYQLTASKSGCSNQTTSVSITVSNCQPTTEDPGSEDPGTEEPTGQPINVCLEAENSNGNGPISGDPNASGRKTRGDQNNFDHYVDYVVDNVPAAGTYKLKITYFASGSPSARISVNGNTVIQSVQLPSTYSWNIVNREEEMNIALVKGSNTIRIQGLSGPSLRQDKICIMGGGSSARMSMEQPVAEHATSEEKLLVFPNPSPADFEVNFNLEKGKEATLVVTDIQGRIWLTKKLKGNGRHHEKISLPGATSGDYLLIIRNGNVIERKKLLLMH
ncbi:CotH kinase family protein [Dyadobacter luticola]|nr:CotH kinase family protein [Dyadobacter luticola]